MPKSGDRCDTAEFLLAVLSEFAAHYLDVLSASGDRPISRAKWEQDAEEDLRLRRVDQERDRQFSTSFGTVAGDQTIVPDAVDLLLRPDCMDDVFAFATAICSRGPEYALAFWSKEELDDGILRLTPTRALGDLREQQKTDDTLRPSYLSFLAALAIAKNADGTLDGAKTIHELLSEEAQQSDRQLAVSWPQLVEMLRWYARELSPKEYGGSSSSTTSGPGGASGGSSSYYYYDDQISNVGQASSAENKSRSEPRELGETNTYILLSHLALISNVASRNATARSAILSVDLPIHSQNTGSRAMVGQDSTLTILFSLAVTALAPEVRGKVFSSIADLVSLDGALNEQREHIRRAATKSWELLEAYQVLPIHLFEQFSSVRSTGVSGIPGLTFPPSSTAMVSVTCCFNSLAPYEIV